jgi:hypothetical protein
MERVDQRYVNAVCQRHGSESTMIMEDVEGISLLSHLVNHVEHSGDMIDFIQ